MITRLAAISYWPFSTDKLLAINKTVLFAILLTNARCFGAFACAAVHTLKHENDALERACMHTQMTTSRTFKFSEYMHINVCNKNMPINCLRPLTWDNCLRPLTWGKGRINKSQQFFVQPEALEPLMLETSNFQG